jgi:hypothetical protein
LVRSKRSPESSTGAVPLIVTSPVPWKAAYGEFWSIEPLKNPRDLYQPSHFQSGPASRSKKSSVTDARRLCPPPLRPAPGRAPLSLRALSFSATSSRAVAAPASAVAHRRILGIRAISRGDGYGSERDYCSCYRGARICQNLHVPDPDRKVRSGRRHVCPNGYLRASRITSTRFSFPYGQRNRS